MVKSALAMLLSEEDMPLVSVRKSFRPATASGRSRWWFTVRAPESVLQSLDLAWADSAASLTWRLQSSLRSRPLPSSAAVPPSSLASDGVEGTDSDPQPTSPVPLSSESSRAPPVSTCVIPPSSLGVSTSGLLDAGVPVSTLSTSSPSVSSQDVFLSFPDQPCTTSVGGSVVCPSVIGSQRGSAPVSPQSDDLPAAPGSPLVLPPPHP